MAISPELFMAILAMDSYNRGYNAGVKIDGNQIGAATLRTIDLPSGAEAHSFFAQAYTLSDEQTGQTGQTVISYRGTDQPALAAHGFSLSPQAGRGSG